TGATTSRLAPDPTKSRRRRAGKRLTPAQPTMLSTTPTPRTPTRRHHWFHISTSRPSTDLRIIFSKPTRDRASRRTISSSVGPRHPLEHYSRPETRLITTSFLPATTSTGVRLDAVRTPRST